jgi:MoaA/NifB/PqqE/SkfB family radical SAM enzyme
MKNCWSVYHELNLTTRGTLSNCCIQHLDVDIDWNSVDDLDKWFRELPIFTQIRESLEAGIEVAPCESCWIQEHSHVISRREYKNKNRNPFTKNDITIKKLDLRISNKCNVQCKMCNAGNSDQILKLGKELYKNGITDLLYDPNVNIFQQTHVSKILDLALKLPNLEMITFAGGEPFIMHEVEEFLLKMVEHNKTYVKVEFITNCTVIKSSVIEVLKKFKDVTISCSIDGIGKQLEYQRYPTKWKIVEQNFKKIYNANFDVVLTPCISMLNLTDLNNFVNWANCYPKATVIYNEVDSPSYLNFRYVPMQERQHLINSNNTLINGDANWNKFFNKLIYEYVEPPLKDCKMLKDYSTKVWDYRCDIKFLDMYPWAKNIIEKINV